MTILYVFFAVMLFLALVLRKMNPDESTCQSVGRHCEEEIPLITVQHSKDIDVILKAMRVYRNN
jgi:hypothetical protein